MNIYSGRASLSCSVANVSDDVVDFALSTDFGLQIVTERMSKDFTSGMARGNQTNRFSFTLDTLRDGSNFINWRALAANSSNIDMTLLLEGDGSNGDGTVQFNGVAYKLIGCEPMTLDTAGKGAGSAIGDAITFFVQKVVAITPAT